MFFIIITENKWIFIVKMVLYLIAKKYSKDTKNEFKDNFTSWKNVAYDNIKGKAVIHLYTKNRNLKLFSNA